jgi:hypothetical protein
MDDHFSHPLKNFNENSWLKLLTAENKEIYQPLTRNKKKTRKIPLKMPGVVQPTTNGYDSKSR